MHSKSNPPLTGRPITGRPQSTPKRRILQHYKCLSFEKSLLVISFFLIVLNSSAQNSNITLSLKNVTLEEVLKEIKEQSGKSILYNNNLIEKFNNESIDIKNLYFEEVLKQILNPKKLNFRIVEDVIVIEPNQTRKERRKNEIRTQIIRGTIIDKQTKVTLPGANIIALNTKPYVTAISDETGNYILEGVPLGRHNVMISYMGYKTITVPNLIISASKEFVLYVNLEEKLNIIEKVKVSAHNKKDAINGSASVSARSFTIEETQRYAGSMGDPSKMASNYAGVVSVNDGRNDIVIRGNAPGGLLWKLEGIQIPNPNHFSTYGTTGGPVPVINPNSLTNSDFFTGAFPAEYGNATAGVFDLKMRNGDDKKHEFMFQYSFMGIEAGLEGPLSKKSKSSYIVNYRYSTLGILDEIGLLGKNTIPAIPKYQDLNFKICFPKTKIGKFSLFGIGGLAHMEYMFKEENDDDFDTHDENENLNNNIFSNMLAVGLSHLKLFSEKSYLKTVIAYTGMSMGESTDTIISINSTLPKRDAKGYENKFILNSFYSYKLNPKNNFKIGLSYTFADQFYIDSTVTETGDFKNSLSADGNYMFLSLYGQWQHKFSDKSILNSGIHSQYLTFNNTFSVEPRIGFRYLPNKKHSFSMGAGLHSQMQASILYLFETQLPDNSYIRTNSDLKMTKSLHLIVAYDYSPAKNFRFKIEPYFQYIFDAPVEKRKSTFSALNIGADFIYPVVDSLYSKGTGKNYGLDITIEKFFSKSYYFLVTGSLYESKYKGSDGVERNTIFNGNYSINALGGVEIKLGKFSALSLDTKISFLGNRRFIPVNLQNSDTAGHTIYNYDSAYSERYKDYFRLDLKAGIRWNRKKTTHYFVVDILNVFNNRNIDKQLYNRNVSAMSTMYQMGRFPNFIYKIEF